MAPQKVWPFLLVCLMTKKLKDTNILKDYPIKKDTVWKSKQTGHFVKVVSVDVTHRSGRMVGGVSVRDLEPTSSDEFRVFPHRYYSGDGFLNDYTDVIDEEEFGMFLLRTL